MARFTLPRDIYFGPNALSELKNLKGYKKAFIVTGGQSMRKTGFLQKLEDVLKDAGLQTRIYDGVEPDPSIERVYDGAKAMREFEPDVIVAIGGGSPMDAAKAMWVFYEYPEKTFEDIKNPFTMPKLRKKAIFVAVPSTSGTASEVTAFSVITDYSTDIKYPLADFEITPDIAVLDSDIPMTMPKTLTAHTGMDALTHAIEAYVASARSDFSDALALKAISSIFDNILDSYNGDAEARGKMHIAQCLAGMAFSNALLGIAHSLAHKTGAVFHIPHGCCNAILLPNVIQYNSRVCMERYAQIAREIGLPGATDKQLTNALVEAIRELNKKLNIAQTYKDNGVKEEDFKAHCQSIAENAVGDPCTASNPRETNAENMLKVLTCAYYGEDVNF
ncbi:iron-containing alcohol dehydrogenase [Caproiciproducens galactitolivorans]|uniref:Aldehyde-alcohol dehydrogenase n=1 Tax=Caproiciproducens galactitolivorans TaxID=642589 RepID=A0A4Z0YJ44_9FIRM|nr:iron-containing alcohol dehydrogenase [Caproiciproducens galactitolivorans]QEY34575.1 iron-containing alcohol dehydrogenase [Caproiciproducens galactitolivorans]TGJ77636.1 aldehyde-alcohol dehydrogenase [Caproiciproducens galactitolivorans]